MVVSPVLRGMFGLHFDAQQHVLTFAPHVPAGWTRFAVVRVAAARGAVDFEYSRTTDSILLNVTRHGEAELRLEFSPAVSPHAQILGVSLNGKNVSFQVEPHGEDQHVTVSANLAAGENKLQIRMRSDFAIVFTGSLPDLGGKSQGLRIRSQTWSGSGDSLALKVEGMPGHTYSLSVLGREQIKSIEGARLQGDGIEITLPEAADPSSPQTQPVTIHFSARNSNPRTKASQ
jgi:hypothetical protein